MNRKLYKALLRSDKRWRALLKRWEHRRDPLAMEFKRAYGRGLTNNFDELVEITLQYRGYPIDE